MAQTFDIRFARSAGITALLETPGNRFRWKGGGLLSIDGQSIRFSVKRGLLTLFARNQTQRIPAEDLREVYREGEALRVEFQTGEAARVVLPFWAGDRATAAQIVRLMPTSHTIEIEHSRPPSKKPRADWRVLMLLGALVAALAAGTWAYIYSADSPVGEATAPMSDRAAPITVLPPASDSMPPVESAAPATSTVPRPQRVEAPAFPLDAARSKFSARPAAEPPNALAPSTGLESESAPVRAPSAMDNPADASPPARRARVTADGVVPIVPGTPSYEAARRQLDLFLAESDTLRGYFREARYGTSRQRFTQLENLWWKVTVRVSNSPDFEDPALRPLQEIELAISRAWRRAFLFYMDPAMLVTADAEVEFAEMLERRARQFVD